MGQLNKNVLEEIVRRIVEVAQPEKMILFGSAVRGEMGPNMIETGVGGQG